MIAQEKNVSDGHGLQRKNVVGLGKTPEPVRSVGNPNLSKGCALVSPEVEGVRRVGIKIPQ